MSAPVTSHNKFLNNPDSFCYICRGFTIPSQRAKISAFVKQAYFAYFQLNLVDQDKPHEPSQSVHALCREFMDVDQKNTRKVRIWYIHGLVRAKRSLHRLLLLFSESIRILQEK